MTRRAVIRWTDLAIGDLREVEAYVRSDRPAAARRLAKRIAKAVARLRSFPRSGRLVPGFEERQFREVIVAPYRIVYRVARGGPRRQSEEVQILRVWHGRRDLDDLAT